MNFSELKKEILACKLCEKHLPLGPRPVFQISPEARILIVGQAPGRKVHETGLPFNDPSGDRLRQWLGVDRETFYDEKKFAIVPMGFCFPGTGKGGDLPPRPECAEEWRSPLLSHLKDLQLTLILGQYAQDWHLGDRKKKTLTATVENWKEYWPELVVLPHPSPRNIRWFKKNSWFEEEIIPKLQKRVSQLL